MTIFLFWLAFSILVGVYANSKGRSGAGFFFLSVILSPLVGIICALIASPDQNVLDRKAIEKGTHRKCPECAELVRKEAQVCKHCGHDFRVQDDPIDREPEDDPIEEDDPAEHEALEVEHEQPEENTPQKEADSAPSRATLWGFLPFLLSAAGIGVFALSQMGEDDGNDRSSETSTTEGAPVTPQTSETIKPADYEIVTAEDQSHAAWGSKSLSDFTSSEIAALPTDKKMLYRVVLPSSITRKQVRPTARDIVRNITAKDPEIDEITLFLYSDKDLADGPYDIGRATWAPKGDLGNVTPRIARTNNRSTYRLSVDVNDGLNAYLEQRNKKEKRFGLSEAKRREIFKAIVAAEDRANADAKERYPTDFSDPDYAEGNFSKWSDYSEVLIKKYRVEVYREYGIDKETGKEIRLEGLSEKWPLD